MDVETDDRWWACMIVQLRGLQTARSCSCAYVRLAMEARAGKCENCTIVRRGFNLTEE